MSGSVVFLRGTVFNFNGRKRDPQARAKLVSMVTILDGGRCLEGRIRRKWAIR